MLETVRAIANERCFDNNAARIVDTSENLLRALGVCKYGMHIPHVMWDDRIEVKGISTERVMVCI